ncbi:hypothetical protein [Streptomyces sp. NPDC059009]|uniref:hypothetical protein n=1 Tax=Streptomyces sp. NPDC059009 TaxID=3346694 RepID=UPI00369FB7C0
MRTIAAATGALAALTLGAAAPGATAAVQGQPDVPGASAQSVHVKGFPWDKKGRDKVPKCARHGSFNSDGYTDHLKLKNKCDHAVTYHIILKRGDDRWHKVRAHKSWRTTWKWPTSLQKVGT